MSSARERADRCGNESGVVESRRVARAFSAPDMASRLFTRRDLMRAYAIPAGSIRPPWRRERRRARVSRGNPGKRGKETPSMKPLSAGLIDSSRFPNANPRSLAKRLLETAARPTRARCPIAIHRRKQLPLYVLDKKLRVR